MKKKQKQIKHFEKRTCDAVVRQNGVIVVAEIDHQLTQEAGRARAAQHPGFREPCGYLIALFVFDLGVQVTVIRHLDAREQR